MERNVSRDHWLHGIRWSAVLIARISWQRKTERLRVASEAHCITNTHRSGEVVIVNLTIEGCCIFTKVAAVRDDLRLLIRPQNFEVLPGLVC